MNNELFLILLSVFGFVLLIHSIFLIQVMRKQEALAAEIQRIRRARQPRKKVRNRGIEEMTDKGKRKR